MDKRQLTEVITDVYKTLTSAKTSVFVKSDDIVNIRVISDSFNGMTFSARFKHLNEMLKSQKPDLFKQHLFIFEAFTSAEVLKLPKDQNTQAEVSADKLKHSAKPLES